MLRIKNITQDRTVCTSARKPATYLARLRGLLGTDSLSPDAGLLLDPSSGVHTFGMRYSIDVVALDRNLRVAGLWHSVAPGRICGLGFRTHSVLELHDGHIRACGLAVGDQLSIDAATEAA